MATPRRKQQSKKTAKPKTKKGGLPDRLLAPITGRQTDYTPERGAELIFWMKQGYSLTAAAPKLGVHRDTIYAWREKYPEFSDSLKHAMGLRVFKLETDLLAAPDGPTVTSRIFALKNAAPDEWKDKHELEHNGDQENPIRILAEQISGNAIRPRLPEPKIIEHEPDAIRPQQYAAPATSVTTSVTTSDDELVTRAEVVTPRRR